MKKSICGLMPELLQIIVHSGGQFHLRKVKNLEFLNVILVFAPQRVGEPYKVIFSDLIQAFIYFVVCSV